MLFHESRKCALTNFEPESSKEAIGKALHGEKVSLLRRSGIDSMVVPSFVVSCCFITIKSKVLLTILFNEYKYNIIKEKVLQIITFIKNFIYISYKV